MVTSGRVARAETGYAAQMERAGLRFESRTAQREENRRTVASRGVLYADEPERVEKRLARLNADWSLARSIERTPSEPATTTGSTLPLGPDEFTADVLGLERLMGRNNLTGVAFLEGGHLAARSVGRVTVTGPGGSRHYGTAFMVSPSLLMTNNHVLSSQEEAGRALVEFNYQAALDGRPLAPASFALEPQRFFATDVDLDFSVVAVAEAGDQGERLADFHWLPLDGSQGKVIIGEFVNIIQHPDGEPKQLALRENQVVDLLDRFLHYYTDTARGSSGSPVCNDQWEVVALHHSAVPETDPEGRHLTVDGALWQPWMGEHKLAWKANEGVRISRVLQALSRLTLNGTAARLRDELFQPKGGAPLPGEGPPAAAAGAATGPGPVPSQGPDGMIPGAHGLLPGPDGQGPAAYGQVPGPGGPLPGLTAQPVSGAAVDVTVPLRITVGVGTPAPERPALDGTAASGAAERDLNAALLNLRLMEGRPYYDREADLAARDAYYAGIDVDSAGDALRDALTGLLEETHERRPSYSPARMLYPWVDLHPDRLLRSVYSGKTFTAEELIRADAAAEAARLGRMQAFMVRESTVGPDRFAAELDTLEASLPFNCEHVVPQSWFTKREPMRGDLHHLFACEPACNSFRSNIPYTDFPGFDEAVRDDCGVREREGFEPGHSKGAVARATLYFLLRYPGLIGDAEGEFPQDRLPVLLGWHESEPVSEYESHRNAAVAEIQGNRNPLIDHPEWSRKVDFSGVWR
ncbi:endonuclease [Streptomyces atroolivaceus]|uniref:endonuclease n=1 Tax=Streptomyces atroolivaceus TaxID=66869 RepID=UPI00343F10CF